MGARGHGASSTTSPGASTCNLTGAVLAQIYLGKITKWNDPAIKKLNKGVNLPNTSITVVHRSDGSGTTYNFTDYLSHVSGGLEVAGRHGHVPSAGRPARASRRAPVSPAPSGRLPARSATSTSYYAVDNHLGIYQDEEPRRASYVLPRAKGIKAAAALDTHPAKDGSLSIVNPPASKKYRNAYPICTYTYVDVQKSSGANAANIKKLISWAITKGQTYGPALIFEPLPKAVVTFDKKQIKKIHS